MTRLEQHGPRVRVVIHGQDREIEGEALIDTGSQYTYVTSEAGYLEGKGALVKLPLTCDCERITWKAHCRLELVEQDISFEGAFAFDMTTPEFHEAGIVAILGRDLLGQCVLTYDGSAGSFELRRNES